MNIYEFMSIDSGRQKKAWNFKTEQQ